MTSPEFQILEGNLRSAVSIGFHMIISLFLLSSIRVIRVCPSVHLYVCIFSVCLSVCFLSDFILYNLFGLLGSMIVAKIIQYINIFICIPNQNLYHYHRCYPDDGRRVHYIFDVSLSVSPSVYMSVCVHLSVCLHQSHCLSNPSPPVWLMADTFYLDVCLSLSV